MRIDHATQITALLRYADPAGPTHARLIKLRALVARNVMLNMADRRFLQELVEIRDTAPCVHLVAGETPRCGAQRRAPCPHTTAFRRCGLYEAPSPTTNKDPLRALRR